MDLQKKVMEQMKAAMKSKDAVALESLRAIKSALLLAKTDGSGAEMTADDEIKLLQRMVKQRKDSAAIFTEQGRADLAEPELAQAKIIETFLPTQMSADEVAAVVAEVIANTGAAGMKDMGKVMGMVSKQLAGQADGKTISTLVKQKLA